MYICHGMTPQVSETNDLLSCRRFYKVVWEEPYHNCQWFFSSTTIPPQAVYWLFLLRGQQQQLCPDVKNHWCINYSRSFIYLFWKDMRKRNYTGPCLPGTAGIIFFVIDLLKYEWEDKYSNTLISFLELSDLCIPAAWSF